MYPFGSGTPYTQPQNPSMYPQNMPFGAGFQAPPNQAPYPSQPQGSYPPQSPYPPQNAPPSQSPYPPQAPYPTGSYPQASYPQSSYPQSSYPQSSSGSYPTPPFGAGFQAPPSNYGNQTNYPSYPSGGGGGGYPAPSQPKQSCPYPPSSTNAGYPSHSSMPNSSSPYPQSYGQPTQHVGHQTVASVNMAQCFSEMRSQSSTNAQKKGTPTVFAEPNFDAVQDAHALRKAMRGFGTDEDGLINILCRRTNQQRQLIQQQYKTHFGKDLIEDIKSETSGNFENLLVALCRPIIEYYCIELCEAMSGIGTDEDVLIETMCTLSNAEIHIIKQNYRRMYGRDIEAEFRSETSGNFKRLLVSLSVGGRDESGVTDIAAAQNDAKQLLKAGELRVGTDESTFNMILCHRNFQQLKLIFEEYQKMTGHSLEKAIKKEFSGDIEDGLLAIYRCVNNKAEYFASRLHKSMAGIGTNDKQLIRIIVTRCEIDMQDVKTAFERKYGKSLKSWIKGDTSGHYKHALYALIGEERSS